MVICRNCIHIGQKELYVTLGHWEKYGKIP